MQILDLCYMVLLGSPVLFYLAFSVSHTRLKISAHKQRPRPIRPLTKLATLTEKMHLHLAFLRSEVKTYHTHTQTQTDKHTHCLLPEFGIAYYSYYFYCISLLLSLYSSALNYGSYAKHSMDSWRLFLDQENLFQDE